MTLNSGENIGWSCRKCNTASSKLWSSVWTLDVSREPPPQSPPSQSHDSSSHGRVHHEHATVHWSGIHSLRLKTDDNHESGQPLVCACSTEQPGPRPLRWNSCRRGRKSRTRHARRDWTVTEQPNATHRRINEAGDSVSSSQDSVTRGVQNLCISDSSCSTSSSACPAAGRHWRIQGDRRDRNNSPKSTFGWRSAVQIPPLTKHPPTKVSCSRWVKKKHGGQAIAPRKALGKTFRSQRCNRGGPLSEQYTAP